MNETKSIFILWGFSLIPYILVAWTISAIGDGRAATFWMAFGGLLVARLLFSIIETLGSVLSWRLYGQKVMIEQNLAVLRSNRFPRRTYAHDDFLSYLSRIEDDPAASEVVRARAKEFRFALSFYENAGILIGMRMHAAAEKALAA